MMLSTAFSVSPSTLTDILNQGLMQRSLASLCNRLHGCRRAALPHPFLNKIQHAGTAIELLQDFFQADAHSPDCDTSRSSPAHAAAYGQYVARCTHTHM